MKLSRTACVVCGCFALFLACAALVYGHGKRHAKVDITGPGRQPIAPWPPRDLQPREPTGAESRRAEVPRKTVQTDPTPLSNGANSSGSNTRHNPSERKFVYMMNAEQCLPDHLASSEAIGNATACDCEVMVLSYKRPCNDTSLRHVEYLYDPSTTWSSGRNVLYEAAMARDQRSLYYIIMDDDIQLEAKDKLNIPNPWRAFERSLLLYEPAIAAPTWTDPEVPNDPRVWFLRVLYSYRRKLGCELSARSSDFIPVVHFDAAFDAFHRDSLRAGILPYSTEYDDVSWWFSQRKVQIKAEIMFRGRVVTHTSITCVNAKHRWYPKAVISNKILLSMVDEIEERELPERYKESTSVISVLQEWREHGTSHYHESSTLCLKPLNIAS